MTVRDWFANTKMFAIETRFTSVITMLANATPILETPSPTVDLPRRLEREIVLDGDDRPELNGDDSRSLATVGAFRVVS